MSKQVYKVGSLVYVCRDWGGSTFHPCTHGDKEGFGIIVSMVDRVTGELYQEKKLITGWGDKNSKINVEIDLLTSSVNEWRDASSSFELLDEKIRLIRDPHHICQTSKKEFDISYDKKLKNMQKMLEFRTKYGMTRDEKISLLVEPEPDLVSK